MSVASTGKSLLLVHAHPDDESIFTGATMARYAAERVRVTLVTCTRGERGPNRLGRLAGVLDSLGALRTTELAAACAALGVTDHRFLGDGRWRDSGAGRTLVADPHSFSSAAVEDAADELVPVIREISPQVIITYDANGFYGHPDHIQAHRVAWRAYQVACHPGHTKFYAVTMPRSVLADAIIRPERPAGGPPRPRAPLDLSRIGLPDDQVTTEIDATSHLDAKRAALAAHATQIVVDGPYFAAVGLPRMRTLGTEYYALLAGPHGSARCAEGNGREPDLFHGL